jgi:hypothetical protein
MFEINSDILVSSLDARILHHVKIVDEIISNLLHIVSFFGFRSRAVEGYCAASLGDW